MIVAAAALVSAAITVQGTSTCPTSDAVVARLRPLLPAGAPDEPGERVQLERERGALNIALFAADGSLAARRPTPRVSAETPPPRTLPPSKPPQLIAKTETLPVRPRPPQAGEGRGEGRASPRPSTSGIPRHAPRPPNSVSVPALAPADDPLAVLAPPPQPQPLPVISAPAETVETADVLMPLPPRLPPTAPPGSALHEEAALLRSAIESLRVQRHPSDALAAVTEHRRRFPTGALATDAQMLRVEALIALGRRQEALVALDDHRLAGETPGGALQVTRAELLADRNCPQGHRRLRQPARLRWFPEGRFREEARRNLIRQ